mmetsp:Transcript_13906/g.25629  ORF Transcript_13906/g.25629 Transcript_13906/m.25629 type:complete len:89 (-) Transcript_13906:669-935(-)
MPSGSARAAHVWMTLPPRPAACACDKFALLAAVLAHAKRALTCGAKRDTSCGPCRQDKGQTADGLVPFACRMVLNCLEQLGTGALLAR